jgi:hypothetical protein
MTEDEDQEIVAALAKLAGQDAAVADDAPAALEWIAGEQDLAFITAPAPHSSAFSGLSDRRA